MENKAMPTSVVVGRTARVALPAALIRQLGLRAGDLLLTVPQDNGGVLLRRIDGPALIGWLRSCNIYFSIPAREMLAQLRLIGFDATLIDGCVSYEGGVLDEYMNRTPAIQAGEFVFETDRGLHNSSDVLNFCLKTVFGEVPPTGMIGASSGFQASVEMLARRMGVPR
jgi:hypothetical protein